MATVNDLQGGLKFLSSGPGLGSRYQHIVLNIIFHSKYIVVVITL